METEKEFSFRSYFVYAMRKWIILVLCVLIGAGAGVYYSMSYKATNIVMYEGTISFDVAEYGSLYYPGELSDGTYSICEAKGRSIMDVASIPKLKSDVYDAVKTRIYPNEKSESAKIQKFLTNLNITRDEDKEAAYNVVYTYINLAKLDIYAANPGLKEKNDAAIANGTGGKVIIESSIGVNYDTAVFGDLTQSNKKPSLVTSPLIGGVGGCRHNHAYVRVRQAHQEIAVYRGGRGLARVFGGSGSLRQRLAGQTFHRRYRGKPLGAVGYFRSPGRRSGQVCRGFCGRAGVDRQESQTR